MCCYFVCFFFFKQKTAYEMRISDWSSDVCSSDLFNVSATNAFLSPAIQQQLADAGETSFTLGRMSRDAFLLRFDAQRETKEIAFGVEGSIGGGWTYDAHYSHGELDSNSRFYNSSIPANFLRAIDAVE